MRTFDWFPCKGCGMYKLQGIRSEKCFLHVHCRDCGWRPKANCILLPKHGWFK